MEASNVKTMREALSAALEQVNKVYDILSRPCVFIQEARQGCREARGVLIPALAAPPRNCDRFGGDIDKLREACARERGINPEEDFPEVFAEWLLAPLTERKGESDASK